MPRAAVSDSQRMSFRIKPADKAMILRATEIAGAAGITDFVLRTVLEASRDIIERNDRIVLSERDTLKVLEALENPPAPNEKMIAAAPITTHSTGVRSFGRTSEKKMRCANNTMKIA